MEITLEKKIYLKLKSHEICSTQNIQNTGQIERRPNVILTETQLNSTFKKSSLRNDLSINKAKHCNQGLFCTNWVLNSEFDFF